MLHEAYKAGLIHWVHFVFLFIYKAAACKNVAALSYVKGHYFILHFVD